MSVKSSSALKTDNNLLFTANGNQEITGEKENEFNEDHIDSFFNRLDDADLVSFKGKFVPTIDYAIGDIVTNNGRLLICVVAASGAFDPLDWIDYDEYHSSLVIPVNHASGIIDLQGNQSRIIRLDGTGTVTIDKIINGIPGRRYRIYLAAAITDFSITSSTVASAISSGQGEVAVNFYLNGSTSVSNMRGNAVPQMSDWFEFVYMNDSGSEYNSVYNIQKHLT